MRMGNCGHAKAQSQSGQMGSSTVPAIGVCTFCNREFKVPMTAMKRVADAQESLRVHFGEHKCKREDTSQAAKNLDWAG